MNFQSIIRILLGSALGVSLLALGFIMEGCGSVANASTPGTSTESSSVVISAPTQLTSNQSGNYTVQSGSLYGMPATTGHGVTISGNVTVTGPALLQDLVINGCLTIEKAPRVNLTRVQVQNCPGDGITFNSSPITPTDGNESCCATLDHVMSAANGGNGLLLRNTADVFISMSEFENNGQCGAKLEGSPTARIQTSDFGGNQRCGIDADTGSAMTMITNSQWGNNHGDDVILESANNIVGGAEFIGPEAHCAIRYTGAQVFGTNFYGALQLCKQ